MKKILILLTLLSNYLFCSFLIVSSSSGIVDGVENEIKLYPLSINFESLTVSSSNSFIEIPIYIKSNSTEAVNMVISNISPLIQGGDSIGISLSYRGRTINNDVPFNLLNEGESGRDGNTIVGKIKVNIPTVVSTQTYGEYSINLDAKLSSNNYSNTSTQSFKIKATVPLVAIAGFKSVSDYTHDKIFIGSTLDYGTFKFNQKNIIEKNLFIKSNSTQNFRIAFDTGQLVSKIDNNYKIPMNYYYNNVPFSTNHTFIALSGKNEGTNNIGVIKFETDTITQELIAGEYEATIGVTITLE